MAIEGSVPALGVIVPHLVVRDAAQAIDFYERAFRQASYTVLHPQPVLENTCILKSGRL